MFKSKQIQFKYKVINLHTTEFYELYQINILILIFNMYVFLLDSLKKTCGKVSGHLWFISNLMFMNWHLAFSKKLEYCVSLSY